MKSITTTLFTTGFCAFMLLAAPAFVAAQQADAGSAQPALSLVTASPDEGFELAIKLARRAVTTTQKNRQVLMEERQDYSRDADALIAVSQVVAIHFQTIAAANNYWNE